MRDELAVHLARAGLGRRCAFHRTRAVVEVVRDDRRRGGARGRHRLGGDVGGASRTARRRSPPVWNQRAPSPRRRVPVDVARRAAAATAVWPRSRAPDGAADAEAALGEVEPVAGGAADAVVRAARRRGAVSTPPWRIRSSTRRPTALSTSAVTTAVRSPKQRRRPRATLYSPPPSQTWKRAGGRDPPLAGVEPQHHLAERDDVVLHDGAPQATASAVSRRDLVAVARVEERRRDHPAAADREDRRQREVAGRVVPRRSRRSARSAPRETARRAPRAAARPPSGSAGKSFTASAGRREGARQLGGGGDPGHHRHARLEAAARRLARRSRGRRRSGAPAATAPSTCSAVRTVPAPTTSPPSRPSPRATCAAAGVRKVTSTPRRRRRRAPRPAGPRRDARRPSATGSTRVRRQARASASVIGPSHPPSTGRTMPWT